MFLPLKEQEINNIDVCLKLFYKVTKETALGEYSTVNMANPGCTERLKKYIPNIKLIVILRNPFGRAYSNYQMYVSWGLENRSVEETVSEELSVKV